MFCRIICVISFVLTFIHPTKIIFDKCPFRQLPFIPSGGRSGGIPPHCGGEPGFNWGEPTAGTRNYMGCDTL